MSLVSLGSLSSSSTWGSGEDLSGMKAVVGGCGLLELNVCNIELL